MTPQEEVQSLLRFLTKDARIPLADALPKIKDIRKYGTVENIAKADPSDLVSIFGDDKVAKVIVNAAKRVSSPRKRPAPAGKYSNKRVKIEEGQDDEELEASLALPETDASAEDLQSVIIETNRAPLYLAYAVQVLKYIHPEQPLSSRLSLAQAAMSQGAQSKAKAIGITNGPTAAEDGFLQGQPKMKVMGQQIAVMRRTVHSSRNSDETPRVKQEDEQIPVDGSQLKIESGLRLSGQHEAFWGIDIEALRKSNGPLIAGRNAAGRPTGPPIHEPSAARGYMLRSIAPSQLVDDDTQKDAMSDSKQPSKKKPSAAEVSRRKEEAAAMLLKAIDVVCKSWSHTLSAEELNRRAGTWYAITRPEVMQGQAGWGQRGQVRLGDILKLRRDPTSQDPIIKAAQHV